MFVMLYSFMILLFVCSLLTFTIHPFINRCPNFCRLIVIFDVLSVRGSCWDFHIVSTKGIVHTSPTRRIISIASHPVPHPPHISPVRHQMRVWTVQESAAPAPASAPAPAVIVVVLADFHVPTFVVTHFVIPSKRRFGLIRQQFVYSFF
jgi:hypothetical protein